MRWSHNRQSRQAWLWLLFISLIAVLPACLSRSPIPTAAPTTDLVKRPLPSPSLWPSFSPPATWTATPRPIPTTTLVPPSPSPSQTSTLAIVVYVFPLQPADVAEYQQGHHDYPAVDILAPVNTRFVAVTNGQVDFVSLEDLWDPTLDDPITRGGLSVAIIGDDGIRYYGSHLSQVESGIAPGVRVIAGQILGYVGTSGNARSLASHLHFGISRPTFPEDWATRRGELDPYPYLLAWEAGQQLIPEFPPDN